MLGAAESGKSTFTKQRKVIQGSGFNAYEREDAKEIILGNLLTSTCIILKCYIEAEKEKAEKVEEKIEDTSFSMKQFGEELLTYLTPEEASYINYYLRQFLVNTKVCINA